MKRPLARSFASYFEGPASVRHAIRLIVLATVGTTLLGAVLVWAFDREEFATFGDAMWWSLQTVTTVGYGDITPDNPVGRVIGSAVILYSVAFLSILTAAITTSFIQQARRERHRGDEPDIGDVLSRLDEVLTRLERLERPVQEGTDGES